jgi:hypothetical protein
MGQYIARFENKSRTRATTIHTGKTKSWIAVVAAACLKKPQPDGCFDCDKVITVQRFSPFEPSKPQC